MLLASCLDSGVDLDGYGDAYILVSSDGKDSLAGLGLHAFSYSEFASVKVTVHGNAELEYNLEPYLGYKQDFIWLTPKAEYSNTIPATGDYVFTATFADGQTMTFFDKLTNEVILPPKIVHCDYAEAQERVEVEWELVPGAGYYNVKLLNGEGELLFVSPAYNSMTNNYAFSQSSQGWLSSVLPLGGDTVSVEVAAYLLEPQSSMDYLQCISRTACELVWPD